MPDCTCFVDVRIASTGDAIQRFRRPEQFCTVFISAKGFTGDNGEIVLHEKVELLQHRETSLQNAQDR
jgi:hypothetical protein